MAANVIFIGSDHVVAWEGATGDGTYLNAATVGYALLDAGGTAVTVSGTPVTGTLDYVADSNGDYRGTIESTVTGTLRNGAQYLLDVTLVQAPFDDKRRLRVYASYRSGNP
ncbi:hypothetical protein VT84_14155 [Gemmata sp. SH-PL17]|uniref:hypothetical protein n=1 Tax=Gemmata sp. SH-PL17 TaxID=1630693 RepID=UPI00078EF485|nr:hypothetical protein [Gemmata sp. SH-PL17]AMV25537.1 hypothetical protein VT84_14155 [Gemmata sp. SH-PL17]